MYNTALYMYNKVYFLFFFLVNLLNMLAIGRPGEKKNWSLVAVTNQPGRSRYSGHEKPQIANIYKASKITLHSSQNLAAHFQLSYKNKA